MLFISLNFGPLLRNILPQARLNLSAIVFALILLNLLLCNFLLGLFLIRGESTLLLLDLLYLRGWLESPVQPLVAIAGFEFLFDPHEKVTYELSFVVLVHLIELGRVVNLILKELIQLRLEESF